MMYAQAYAPHKQILQAETDPRSNDRSSSLVCGYRLRSKCHTA